MNSHALAVSSWFFASPLGKGERTKVRACTCVIASVNPHPTLSNTPLPRSRSPEEEANIALTT